MQARQKNNYKKDFTVKLKEKLGLKNINQVPKCTKIVLNMGLGEDASDSKKVKACQDDLTLIAGQKAVITKFKKSIRSNWLSTMKIYHSLKRLQKRI